MGTDRTASVRGSICRKQGGRSDRHPGRRALRIADETFGGIEQLTWSPDSKCIAYTCRKKTGLEYAISTDSDIYLYNLETKQTRNLCKEDATDKNMGYDTNPQFSPTADSLPGKAWNATDTKATATAFA